MSHARTPSAPAMLVAFLLVLSIGCGRQSQVDPLTQAMSQASGPTKTKGEKAQEPPAPVERNSAKPAAQVKLAVLRVTDDRLPDLDEEQFLQFLQTLGAWAEKISRSELEYDVRPAVAVETYFKNNAGVLKEPLAGRGPAASSFDPFDPKAELALQECLAQVDQLAIRTYFSDAPAELDTIEKWSEYLAKDLRTKWAAFHKSRPPHPALISEDHPEFSNPGLWRALAENERVDVVVTNALIAGAERGMDLDRINRGGLLVGLWSAGKKKNALGATLVVSVQPILCRSPFVIDVPDRARPAVAAIYTWSYLHAFWKKGPPVVDPLGTAVRLISGNQER